MDSFPQIAGQASSMFHNWWRSCQASVLPMSTPFLRPRRGEAADRRGLQRGGDEGGRNDRAGLGDGGKLMFCGNGGSAVTRSISRPNSSPRSITGGPGAAGRAAPTTDTSFLTAYANDFGFEGVFARQLGLLAGPAMCLSISTSGIQEMWSRPARRRATTASGFMYDGRERRPTGGTCRCAARRSQQGDDAHSNRISRWVMS